MNEEFVLRISRRSFLVLMASFGREIYRNIYSQVFEQRLLVRTMATFGERASHYLVVIR